MEKTGPFNFSSFVESEQSIAGPGVKRVAPSKLARPVTVNTNESTVAFQNSREVKSVTKANVCKLSDVRQCRSTTQSNANLQPR
jgi:hypothetical protein